MNKAIIYTRRGDDGTTSLADGKRVTKDNVRVEAYGTIDELNAHLGLLAAAIEDKQLRFSVEALTNNLFAIGGCLACETVTASPVTVEAIKSIEEEIDILQSRLEPIKSFLLPPVTEAAARANVCRTICRRAERRIVTLANTISVHSEIIMYINRLSDYLFTLSRILSAGNEKFVEKHWK